MWLALFLRGYSVVRLHYMKGADMKLSALKIDSRKAADGVWVNFPGTEARFRVARVSNAKCVAALQVINETHDGKYLLQTGAQSDAWADDDYRAAMMPAITQGLLRDWDKVEDDNGDAIEYTPETASQMLDAEGFEDVLAFIVQAGAMRERFRADQTEAAAGN